MTATPSPFPTLTVEADTLGHGMSVRVRGAIVPALADDIADRVAQAVAGDTHRAVRGDYSASHGRHYDVVPDVADIPGALHFGRVNTGHYLFEALGHTREEVEDALRDAYALHAARNPYADPDVMVEAIDDDEVSWTLLRPGQAAIDGDVVA